jgi:hypothetical protein
MPTFKMFGASAQPDTGAAQTGMLSSSPHRPREYTGLARGRNGRDDPQEANYGRS